MITEKLFNGLFPTAGLNPQKYNLVRERARLIAALNSILPKYNINTHKRICAFLANCGIETDYFKTTSEYSSGWDYDISVNPRKAKSLGNTEKGDGIKYKGSGLTQTTGKYNFKVVQKSIGEDLKVDVVKHPEILRDNIEIAVESACMFWDDHDLNAFADRGEFKKLSGIVNRGSENKTPLHWAKRSELYSKLLRCVPKDFEFDAPVQISTAVENSATVVENNSPESLAVPPSPPVSENQPATDSEAKLDKSKIKEFGEKFLRHCPKDKISNILLVVGTRIFSTISGVWFAGLHGKILLIAAAVAVLFFTARAIYFYAPRIYTWAKKIFSFFFND